MAEKQKFQNLGNLDFDSCIVNTFFVIFVTWVDQENNSQFFGDTLEQPLGFSRVVLFTDSLGPTSIRTSSIPWALKPWSISKNVMPNSSLEGWLTHQAKHPEVKDHVGLHECILLFFYKHDISWYANSNTIIHSFDIMFTIWMFQFQIRPRMARTTRYWRFRTLKNIVNPSKRKMPGANIQTFCLATTNIQKNQPLVLAPPNSSRKKRNSDFSTYWNDKIKKHRETKKRPRPRKLPSIHFHPFLSLPIPEGHHDVCCW